MSTGADIETTFVELEGGSVPVLLFAGGTTGLLLLANTDAGRAFCVTIGELAESMGLSALAFAGEICGDQALAASRGLRVLESLGIKRTVLVGIGATAGAALRAAADGRFGAVALVDPFLPLDDLEPLLAELREPKLVLVRANDPECQEIGAAVYRAAVGPLVLRHLWGQDLLAGKTAALAAEATLAFVVGVCGDGRPA